MEELLYLLGQFERSLDSADESRRRASYELAWELAVAIRRQVESSRQAYEAGQPRKLIERLAEIYRAGDEAVKRCIVDGILEHVFESIDARNLFDEWSQSPELSGAWQEASQWADAQIAIQTCLSRVALHCIEYLKAKGAPTPVLRGPAMGTDLVVFEWAGSPLVSGVETLVFEPSDDLADSLRFGLELSDHDIRVLAEHALDPANWRPSEHLSSEKWVELPTP